MMKKLLLIAVVASGFAFVPVPRSNARFGPYYGDRYYGNTYYYLPGYPSYYRYYYQPYYGPSYYRYPGRRVYYRHRHHHYYRG